MKLEDGSAVMVRTVSTSEVCIDFVAPPTTCGAVEFMRVTLNKQQLHELMDELLKHSKGLKYVQ